MRSAEAAGAATLLTDLAEALDATVEDIRDPTWLETKRRDRIELFAGLLAADPQFARIALAFLSLRDPAGRRAVADTTVAIARAFTGRTEAVVSGFPPIPHDLEPS